MYDSFQHEIKNNNVYVYTLAAKSRYEPHAQQLTKSILPYFHAICLF